MRRQDSGLMLPGNLFLGSLTNVIRFENHFAVSPALKSSCELHVFRIVEYTAPGL